MSNFFAALALTLPKAEISPTARTQWRRLGAFYQQHPVACAVVALYGASRLLLLAVGWVAVHVIPPDAAFQPPAYWAAWDSLHYLRIAHEGYVPATATTNPAFFPGYPLMVKLGAALLGGNAALAALLITNASWCLALVQFAALVRDDFLPRLAYGAVAAYLLFPMAFFCFVPYPEALFLACAIGAFRAMRLQHWWLAALLGCCAALTRQAGLLLAVPFLWEYLRAHRQVETPARWWQGWRLRADLAWVLLIPCGILAYSLWLWRSIGDPLAFAHAEATWHRAPIFPALALWRGLLSVGTLRDPVLQFRAWLDLFLIFGTLALVISGWRHLPWNYRIYLAGTWGLFLSNVTDHWVLISQPRYVLEVFPIFIIVGHLLLHHRWVRVAYGAVGVTLQIALFGIFSRGGWIT